MLFFGFLLLYCLYSIKSFDVKIFVRNTNYGNYQNWKERQVPCDQSHIILPRKSPKIFINGTSTTYHISEMVLPFNGELILDDSAVLTVTDESRESVCELVMSHYEKVTPDFWYDPGNWCQARSITSDCVAKPRIEAALVPTETDTAVFRARNTFYVGLKATEPNIVARQISLRGIMYQNTLPFRQKIKRTSKNNIVEFENVSNNYPPIIILKRSRCSGNSCSVNSNLKKMTYICSYVSSCRPVSCSQPIKPSGSCCQICGRMFNVTSRELRHFETWFDDLMDTYTQSKLMYNLLPVGASKVEIVLSSLDLNTDLLDSLASDIVERIRLDKVQTGVTSVDGMSWTMSVPDTKSPSSTLVVILILVCLAVIAGIVFAFRRKLPKMPVSIKMPNIGLTKLPDIKWPTFNFNFLNDTFPRTRLNEEAENVTMPGSMYPSMEGAIEAIEMPAKVADVSFDNPIYDVEMSYEDSLQ